MTGISKYRYFAPKPPISSRPPPTSTITDVHSNPPHPSNNTSLPFCFLSQPVHLSLSNGSLQANLELHVLIDDGTVGPFEAPPLLPPSSFARPLPSMTRDCDAGSQPLMELARMWSKSVFFPQRASRFVVAGWLTGPIFSADTFAQSHPV